MANIFLDVITLGFLIRRTQWYKSLFLDENHTIYPDNTWYRSHAERDFQLVVLGSSGAKWAFDFQIFRLKL